MWSRSHAAEAEPTTVSSTPGAFEVHTPAATLNNQVAFERIVTLVQVVGNRRPLPKPDGLVAHDLTPLPNTAEQAALQVNAVNADIAKTEAEAIRELTRAEETHPVLINASGTDGTQAA
jgi:hypothetical protein